MSQETTVLEVTGLECFIFICDLQINCESIRYRYTYMYLIKYT